MILKSIGRGHKLEEKAANAFLAMCESAKADLGINLTDFVNVSVRSTKRQKELYDAWVAAGKPAATPVAEPNGKGEHAENNANALDINQASDARILPYLCKRGPTFGFYATASNEKHHWAWYAKRPPLTRWIRHLANLKRWKLG